MNRLDVCIEDILMKPHKKKQVSDHPSPILHTPQWERDEGGLAYPLRVLTRPTIGGHLKHSWLMLQSVAMIQVFGHFYKQ